MNENMLSLLPTSHNLKSCHLKYSTDAWPKFITTRKSHFSKTHSVLNEKREMKDS